MLEHILTFMFTFVVTDMCCYQRQEACTHGRAAASMCKITVRTWFMNIRTWPTCMWSPSGQVLPWKAMCVWQNQTNVTRSWIIIHRSPPALCTSSCSISGKMAHLFTKWAADTLDIWWCYLQSIVASIKNICSLLPIQSIHLNMKENLAWNFVSWMIWIDHTQISIKAAAGGWRRPRWTRPK